MCASTMSSSAWTQMWKPARNPSKIRSASHAPNRVGPGPDPVARTRSYVWNCIHLKAVIEEGERVSPRGLVDALVALANDESYVEEIERRSLAVRTGPPKGPS